MSQVIIGMDPHKRSATIEVVTSDETVLGGGRYNTSPSGYRAMRRAVRRWPERTWAIEGCQGIGRHLANRLLADVAARAQRAAARSVKYLQVVASNDSAPIWRRLGFRAVTSTTAYVWAPPQPARPG